MALTRHLLAAVVLAACTPGEGGEATSAATGASTLVATATGTTAGDGTTAQPTDGGTTLATGDTLGGTSGDATAGTATGTTDATTSATTAATGTGTTGGDPGLDPDAPPVTEGRWYRPGLAATWNYQLTGELVTYDIDVHIIDLFDGDEAAIAGLQAEGRKVICYFSAGSGEDWRPDYDQLDPAALGQPLDGWPGEVWLDFRHPSVLAVMLARMDLAVQKGCDGVDPDNVDGYTQDSGFVLSATEQIAYNRWLGNRAHERGLAVGLKNDLEQVPELVDYFDLAVNEQCHEWDECDLLAPFTAAGKPVFNVEYPGDEADAAVVAPAMCPQSIAADLRTVFLPLELDGSWRLACD